MKKILIFLIFCIYFSNSAMAMSSLNLSFDIGSSDSSSSDSSSSDSSSSDSSSSDSSSSDSSSSDSSSIKTTAIDKDKDESKITTMHIKASCARNVKKPKFFRETSPDYFSTYIGGIINAKSLNEFFNITNNQYKQSCDIWYRKYFTSQFHKALVFAYNPKDIKDVSSYWGFSHNSSSRLIAEQDALKACNASNEKKESHKCAILFSNNNILNQEYLILAKQSY
jgi:hypothetical protein